MGQLSKEILEEIYTLIEGIIGEKSLRLLKRRIEEKGIKDVPRILFEVADEMGKLLGKRGAYATLREVGREVARNLMQKYPREEWERIFEEGLNIMGFAKGVKREGNRACICSCIFYPQFLEPRKLKPTEHPICWIGWGFIEGFMKEFTGALGVEWKERDYVREQCWFEVIQPK